jgi:uncharacterized protein YdaT
LEENTMDEGLVIAIAISKAKEWVAKHQHLYPEN